jgi:hypothetical protein
LVVAPPTIEREPRTPHGDDVVLDHTVTGRFAAHSDFLFDDFLFDEVEVHGATRASRTTARPTVSC